MAVALIPIVAAALPEIVKLISELIDYMENRDTMTPEQRQAAIESLKSRKQAALDRVEALDVRDV